MAGYEQENENVSTKFSSLVQEQLLETVKRNFLSEPMIPLDRSDFVRKISSDPNFYNVNYDDLCGPFSYPDNPVYQKYDIPLTPRVCTWIFITEIDMIYIQQHQDDKEAILSLIGKKLPNSILFAGGINKDIFLQLMWEVFRFARDNNYTGISISSLLGIFYFTHRYFLTTLWRTQAETYEFFKENVLLHSVLHPPKSIEVFTLTESKQSLDLFCTIYMRQLPLIRLVCLPNYKLVLMLEEENDPGDNQEEEKLNEKKE